MVLETIARCALGRSRRNSEAYEGSRRPSAAGIRALPAGGGREYPPAKPPEGAARRGVSPLTAALRKY